jgi:acetyl esterase/lipase
MTDAKVGWSSRDMDKAISLEAAPKRTICSPVSNGFGTRWSTDSDRTADPHRRSIAMQTIQRRPTLFLHGEEDQTSSTNQSMVYFDALQERGVPTRFIKFPRQKHGIREPRLLRVRIVEELRWMQKYVRGLDWIPWTRPKKDDQPERVVFHSDRDGNSEIYAISPTCADETRLTDNDSYRKSDAARFRQ